MSVPRPATGLRRVLSVRDLVLYGMVLITPLAPVGIFGLANQMSKGHVTLTILLAMAAMVFTAISYGRMASLYPVAGSAFSYVGRGLDLRAGFLCGWSMALDYLIIPVINVIYISLTLGRLIPGVPFWVWSALTVASMTILNLQGIKATAKASLWLMSTMLLVLAAFFVRSGSVLWARGGMGALFTSGALVNPGTLEWSALGAATSLAALTYIGFDGVTTLAEETEDPARTVPLATVLVCLLSGLLSAAEVYLAHLLWPDFASYVNPETAFLDVSRMAGGPLLFHSMGAVIALSCFGSGVMGQASAARVLFSMGREGVLPRRLFGRLDERRGQPSVNVVVVGMLAWTGAMVLSYERAATLLNFGAFLSFLGVNAAAFRASRHAPRPLAWALPAAIGFAFCLWIWLSLPAPAKWTGGLWLLCGIGYLAWLTSAFRRPVPEQLMESIHGDSI